MAVLIPDEECPILLIKKYFWLVQYAAGYHLGPVASPRTDGPSFVQLLLNISGKYGFPYFNNNQIVASFVGNVLKNTLWILSALKTTDCQNPVC